LKKRKCGKKEGGSERKKWAKPGHYYTITGVAKVRPSKDFLRPLCQILDA